MESKICILILLTLVAFSGCVRVDNKGYLVVESSCNDKVSEYDIKISDLRAKYDYMGCTIPNEAESPRTVRCNELYYDLTTTIQERNSLPCVVG